MVTLVPIQTNSFNSLCQGTCHQWHLPRVNHTHPGSDLREPSNLFHLCLIGYSLGKFLTVLYHTALPTAAPFLLTSVQPKRQLLPEETFWFTARLCFPDVFFPPHRFPVTLQIWVRSRYFCLPPPPQKWRTAELYESVERMRPLGEMAGRCRGPCRTLSRKWVEGSSHESLKPWMTKFVKNKLSGIWYWTGQLH